MGNCRVSIRSARNGRIVCKPIQTVQRDNFNYHAKQARISPLPGGGVVATLRMAVLNLMVNLDKLILYFNKEVLCSNSKEPRCSWHSFRKIPQNRFPILTVFIISGLEHLLLLLGQ